MYSLKVRDLKRYLSNALETLEDFSDDVIVNPLPNTYKISMPYLGTSVGYIPLNGIERTLDDDTYEDYRVMDSKRKPAGRFAKLIAEGRSMQRELFEYLEDYISMKNREDDPEYDTKRLVAYAKGLSYPDFDKLIDGILREYAETMSTQLKQSLENAKVESPSMFTDIMKDRFEEAAGNVASSVEFPGY